MFQYTSSRIYKWVDGVRQRLSLSLKKSSLSSLSALEIDRRKVGVCEFLVFAFGEGNVVLYDLRSNEERVERVSNVKVTALCIAEGSVFCGDAEGSLFAFGIDGGKARSVWKSSGAVSCINFDKKNDMLYVAAKGGSRVYRMTREGVVESKFEKVSNPPITGIEIANGVAVVLYDHRMMRAYYGPDQVTYLTCTNRPVALEVSDYPVSKNSSHYLAVTENGDVNIFSVPKNRKSNPNRSANSIITINGQNALNACFREQGIVTIAYGSENNLQYKNVKYMNSSGTMFQNIQLVSDESDNLLLPAGADPGKKSNADSKIIEGKSRATIMDPNTVKEENDKLKTFASMLDRVDTKDVSKTPRVESVKHALLQGIKNNDNEALSRILQHTQENIVFNTVANLPSSHVIKFLNIIITKFKKKPKYGLFCVVWLRAVLIQHTSYLMTIPGLIEELSEVYTTIDSRVSVFDDLLQLQGRMDLLLSQIEAKKQKQSFGLNQGPANVYSEVDESSDESESSAESESDEEESNDSSGSSMEESENGHEPMVESSSEESS